MIESFTFLWSVYWCFMLSLWVEETLKLKFWICYFLHHNRLIQFISFPWRKISQIIYKCLLWCTNLKWCLLATRRIKRSHHEKKIFLVEENILSFFSSVIRYNRLIKIISNLQRKISHRIFQCLLYCVNLKSCLLASPSIKITRRKFFSFFASVIYYE